MTDATQLLDAPATPARGRLRTPEAPTAAQKEAAELKALATAAYAESVEADEPLSGAALGAKFDRSSRWGRAVIADAAAAGVGTLSAIAAAATPAPERNGSHSHEVRLPVLNGWQPPVVEVDPAATARQPDPPEATPVAATRQPIVNTFITLVVGLVALAASYGHMYEVALMAGEPEWIARAFPITVDGLVFAALKRGQDGRRWLWLGLAISVAANIVGKFPELAADVGPVVSAWPPLALYGTHRLLHGARGSAGAQHT